MNGSGQPKNHTPLIVICVTIMGLTSIILGSYLISKGYMSGELLLSSGGVAAISGLLGMAVNRPPTPMPDVTFSSQPPKLELTQQPKVESGK